MNLNYEASQIYFRMKELPRGTIAIKTKNGWWIRFTIGRYRIEAKGSPTESLGDVITKVEDQWKKKLDTMAARLYRLEQTAQKPLNELREWSWKQDRLTNPTSPAMIPT